MPIEWLESCRDCFVLPNFFPLMFLYLVKLVALQKRSQALNPALNMIDSDSSVTPDGKAQFGRPMTEGEIFAYTSKLALNLNDIASEPDPRVDVLVSIFHCRQHRAVYQATAHAAAVNPDGLVVEAPHVGKLPVLSASEKQRQRELNLMSQVGEVYARDNRMFLGIREFKQPIERVGLEYDVGIQKPEPLLRLLVQEPVGDDVAVLADIAARGVRDVLDELLVLGVIRQRIQHTPHKGRVDAAVMDVAERYHQVPNTITLAV